MRPTSTALVPICVLLLASCAQLAGLGDYGPSASSGAGGMSGTGAGDPSGGGGGSPILQLLWALAASSDGDSYVGGLDVDATGRPLLCGSFAEGLTLDDQLLAATEAVDGFVARLTSDGGHQWSSVLSGQADQRCTGAAYTDGGVLLTGPFELEVNVGGESEPGATDQRAFVARLDISGAVQSLSSLGSTSGDDVPFAIADSPNGWVMAGLYQGDIQFGMLTVVPTGDTVPAGFVAAKDSTADWITAIGSGADAAPQVVRDIAVDTSGRVVAVGETVGPLTIGFPEPSFSGSPHAFVMALLQGGEPGWLRSAGGSGQTRAWSVAVADDGSTLVAGQFTGSFAFEEQEEVAAFDEKSDAFVAELDPDGEVLWVTIVTGPGQQIASAVDTVDERVVVVGQTDGPVDVAGVRVLEPPGPSGFVLVFDGSGEVIASTLATASIHAELGFVTTVSDTTQVVVAGGFKGADLTFHGLPVPDATVSPHDQVFAASLMLPAPDAR